MTACTSFLAFFAEQTLAFAEKMHSRPDRWPQIVRFASGRADSLANQRFVNDQSARGPKPFRALIVPGGVYGGDGAIFAPENPIFQSKNPFPCSFRARKSVGF